MIRSYQTKIIRLLALIVATAACATATPVYTDVDPNTRLSEPSQTIPIDLDANGTVDFSLYRDVRSSGVFIHLNIPVDLQSTNNVVVTGLFSGGGRDEVLGLGPNQPVPNERAFNARAISGNGPIMAQPATSGLDLLEGQGVRYMGVRFTRSGATHYGWIRIEVNRPGTEAILYGYAYESVADTPIMTGIPGAVLVEQINVTGAGGSTEITVDGGTLQMMAEVLPANALEKEIRWSVDDTTTAIIDASGLLRARGNGGVTVIATSTDGSRVEGTTTVVVSGQIVRVTRINVRSLLGDTVISSANGSLEVTADVEPGNATNQAVAWSVDDETKATITEYGILTAKANGRVIVTATATDGSGVTGSTGITITGQPVAAVDRIAKDLLNPRIRTAGGHITIELAEGSKMLYTIQVFDMTGRNVATHGGEQSGTALTIDCSSLPSGLYVVAGDIDNSYFARRVMIVR